MTRRQLVDQARQWIGIPFVANGRTRFGVDCIGLLIGVCNELGVSFTDSPNFRAWVKRAPYGDLGLDYFRQNYTLVSNPQFGDIAILSLTSRMRPQHIGIITDYNGTLGLIHTYAGLSGVIEMPLGAWVNRIALVFTLPYYN